jgi:hypothetical protein
MVYTILVCVTHLISTLRMSLFGSWGPGSKQEIALVNLVPRYPRFLFDHPIYFRLSGGFFVEWWSGRSTGAEGRARTLVQPQQRYHPGRGTISLKPCMIVSLVIDSLVRIFIIIFVFLKIKCEECDKF